MTSVKFQLWESHLVYNLELRYAIPLYCQVDVWRKIDDFQWNLIGFFRDAHVGHICSGSGSGVSAQFCPKISIEMVLGS